MDHETAPWLERFWLQCRSWQYATILLYYTLHLNPVIIQYSVPPRPGRAIARQLDIATQSNPGKTLEQIKWPGLSWLVFDLEMSFRACCLLFFMTADQPLNMIHCSTRSWIQKQIPMRLLKGLEECCIWVGWPKTSTCTGYLRNIGGRPLMIWREVQRKSLKWFFSR